MNAANSVLPAAEGWDATEAFLLVKSVDETGNSSWNVSATSTLSAEEILGVLTAQIEAIREQLVQSWKEEGRRFQPVLYCSREELRQN